MTKILQNIKVSHRLYGGDDDMRIRQEYVLMRWWRPVV